MFDFSIEFAMEAFIIVLLGVAISMFVAFITNIDKELALHDKNIDKELALHDQKSSAENTSLSKEHASLSSSLSRGYAALSQELSQISGDIKVVRERQAEDRIKQEMSFKSLAESVSEMEKFVEQFTRIAAESNQLQAENNQLRGQLQLQRERILELERQRSEIQ